MPERSTADSRHADGTPRHRRSVADLELAETVLGYGCALALIIWMSIGTIARSQRLERIGHDVMSLICIATAAGLFWFHSAGGAFWGSQMLARPLALVLIVFGIASRFPLKGVEIQGEPNPHQIMKMRREERAAADAIESEE